MINTLCNSPVVMVGSGHDCHSTTVDCRVDTRLAVLKKEIEGPAVPLGAHGLCPTAQQVRANSITCVG